MSDTPPPKSEKYSVRFLIPVLEVFDQVTERLGTNRTARLEEHMLADIRLHGTPEEKRIVEEAVANRPRRGPNKRKEPAS